MSSRPSSPATGGTRQIALGGRLSLEWKLPLLVTVFVAAGLAAMLAFTYTTLAARAHLIVRDRLHHAVREIAATADASLAQRANLLRTAAADASIQRVLSASRTGAPPSAGDLTAARAALARLGSAQDSAAELWDATGRVVAFVGPAATRDERGAADAARALFASGDAVRFGALYPDGERVGFWAMAPVMVDGARIGWVAQPRHVGGPRTAERSLRELLREDVRLYTRSADGSVWAAVPGALAPGPLGRDSSGDGVTYRRPGGRVIAEEAAVAGTQWMMVLETPESWIAQRPRKTIGELALLALLVTAVAGVLAWLASRRITRPLATLTDASEALAAGRYDPPVTGAGRDEIGRLATAFDSMAREVAQARAELEGRVTEAQRAAGELEDANRQLRDAMAQADRARAEAELANRAKADFLAVMSHELRTPLNAIAGYVQILEMGILGPVSDPQRDALQRVERSQAHLLSLINDVLNFARIDAGQVQYTMADVPLYEVLGELEAMLEPQVREAGLAFRRGVCEPALVVRADADKLRQVLLNLLGNAVKYTPAGGTITVECEAVATHVRVHVRDTGTGIRAERLGKIFEPFVQGERALNNPDEGLGLGLAISRDLAHGMGGDLTVESEPGEGSVFTLTLQRAPARTVSLPAGTAIVGAKAESGD